MAGTPDTFGQLDELLDASLQQVKPTLTYRYDADLNRIIGMTDGKHATWQAIWKLLRTVQYAHVIYDWRYGQGFERLLGKPKPYAKVELERMIEEAVMQDDRVTGISNFEVVSEGVDFVEISVTIETITMPYIFDLEVPW